MSYVANRVNNRLFIGGFPPFGDELVIADIDVNVLCAKENQNADKYEGVEVICAPDDDDPRPHHMKRFLPVYLQAATQVANYVRAGKMCSP